MRGKRVAMIFQDPLSSLHPLYKIGWQIEEAIRAHERRLAQAAARARAIEALRAVEIPSAAERVDALSARALGRDAPARDDRDGARPRPGAS